jgi:hypothetical protein
MRKKPIKQKADQINKDNFKDNEPESAHLKIATIESVPEFLKRKCIENQDIDTFDATITSITALGTEEHTNENNSKPKDIITKEMISKTQEV